MTRKTEIKEKKEVVTSQEEIDEMSKSSGEQDVKVAPKYPLASLKMNGNTGKFYKTVLEDGEMVLNAENKAQLDEVDNPTGVILKPRKSFAFDEAESQLFTSEGGNKSDSIFSVFQKSPTQKGFSTNLIFQGTPAQVKEKFPGIKMTQILYFLLDQTGEIVRLKVKGMSLGQIFDYWKEFPGANDHLFQYKTILKSKKDKNKYGTFYVNTFTKGEQITDLSEVRVAIDEVKERVGEIEAFYAERDKEAKNYNEGKEFKPETDGDGEIVIEDKKTLKEKADEASAIVKETNKKIKTNSEGQKGMDLKGKPDDKEIDTDDIPY